jgi:hypothetical protein
MGRSLQAHSGIGVCCQHRSIDPRTWAMLRLTEMKGDLLYHRPSRFPLAKALLLCYDAWWNGFDCQVSNHTPRRQHHFVSSCNEMGQCGGHGWVEHKFEDMFCRSVVDTLASIKPAVALTSTNDGV